MKMKHFGIATLLLSAMAFTVIVCLAGQKTTAQQGVTVSGAQHKKQFPQGHATSEGKNCYYDDKHDVFLCPFAMDNKTSEQGVAMSGEQHKKQFPQGHENETSNGKNCYYDYKQDVFLCPFEIK